MKLKKNHLNSFLNLISIMIHITFAYFLNICLYKVKQYKLYQSKYKIGTKRKWMVLCFLNFFYFNFKFQSVIFCNLAIYF